MITCSILFFALFFSFSIFDRVNSKSLASFLSCINLKEVSERSVKAWEEICLAQKNKDLTLLVAHDAVNKTLICNLLGIDFSNIWMIKQGNGGITVIDLFKDPQKDNVISALNITPHLGGILDSTVSGAL